MTDLDPRRTGVAVAVLLALRFLLELALLVGYVVACVRLLDGTPGWVVGLLLAAVVATVWGLVLSPRRRFRIPIAGRVAIEVVLFATASVLLVLSGLVVLGAALMALELLDLGLLQGPDKHAP